MNTTELIGRTVAGVRIEGRLGEGGGGSVMRGVQPFLERPVAVKLLSSKLAKQPGFVERFTTEARLLAGLSHPNIARVYSMAVDSGRHAMVMELIEGIDLAERLTQRGPLPPVEAAYVFLQIARALDAAASCNIVHRDIKPANVMLTPGGLAKLVDFGIAGRFDPTAERKRKISGSVFYMSPEQARGEPLDHRSDLYSLGITMWHALTGSVPFEADNPISMALHHVRTPFPTAPPEIPLALVDLMQQLTAKQPIDRPREAAVVIRRLENFLGTVPHEDWALVVEPDGGRGVRLVEGLRAAGTRSVVRCQSGAEALTVLELRQRSPLVVALQLSLPAVDAGAVLRIIERKAGERAARVLLVSDSEDLLDVATAEAFRLGVRWRAVAGDADVDAIKSAALYAMDSSAPQPVRAPRCMSEPDARARVERVADLGLQTEGHLDAPLGALAQRAAVELDMPAALVSLVLADHQWFKAHVGLPEPLAVERGTPIDQAFCATAVRSGQALVVNDAATHPTYRDNPLVLSGAVGSYAGAPIVGADGTAFGTVCVLDAAPRALHPTSTDALRVLARRAGGIAHVHAPGAVQSRDLKRQLGVDRLANFQAIRPDVAALVFNPAGRIIQVSVGVALLFEADIDALVGLDRRVFIEYLTSIAHPDAAVERTLRVPHGSPYTASELITLNGESLRWTAWPHREEERVFQIERFERRLASTQIYDSLNF